MKVRLNVERFAQNSNEPDVSRSDIVCFCLVECIVVDLCVHSDLLHIWSVIDAVNYLTKFRASYY